MVTLVSAPEHISWYFDRENDVTFEGRYWINLKASSAVASFVDVPRIRNALQKQLIRA
jgi:hypothetical protein